MPYMNKRLEQINEKDYLWKLTNIGRFNSYWKIDDE